MKNCLLLLLFINGVASASEYQITSLDGKLLHSSIINGQDQLDCDQEVIRTYSVNHGQLNFINHIHFRNKNQCLKLVRCLEQSKVSDETPVVLQLNSKNKVRVNGFSLPDSCGE